MTDEPNTDPDNTDPDNDDDEQDISDVGDPDIPDDAVQVAADGDQAPDVTPLSYKAADLADKAVQFEQAAATATGDQKDALMVMSRQYQAESQLLLEQANSELKAWNQAQEEKNLTEWVQFSNDVVAYDAALSAGQKMDSDTRAFWLNYWAHNDLDNPRRQQIMHGLFDAYYNTPMAHKPVAPPQTPPSKERQKPPGQEMAAPRPGAAPVSAQMLDFYVQTRKYAQGLSWEALNNNVYQYGNAVAVVHPTLVPRLQFRAYIFELLARYRHARVD